MWQTRGAVHRKGWDGGIANRIKKERDERKQKQGSLSLITASQSEERRPCLTDSSDAFAVGAERQVECVPGFLGFRFAGR